MDARRTRAIRRLARLEGRTKKNNEEKEEQEQLPNDEEEYGKLRNMLQEMLDKMKSKENVVKNFRNLARAAKEGDEQTMGDEEGLMEMTGTLEERLGAAKARSTRLRGTANTIRQKIKGGIQGEVGGEDTFDFTSDAEAPGKVGRELQGMI